MQSGWTTAQAYITTDLDDNQITAFHPGAMERAHEAPVDTVNESYRVGIVAPNGKQAMIEHARTLKENGTPCVVDPGQGLPMFTGPALLSLIEGAAVYVVNDYEWALTLEKTGLSEDALAERVGAVVVTLGEKGSRLRRGGLADGPVLAEASCDIPCVRAEKVVDPTGCGDAFRAGILYALEAGLPLEHGARAGSLLGALKIARAGPQSIEMDPPGFRRRFEQEFGQALG